MPVHDRNHVIDVIAFADRIVVVPDRPATALPQNLNYGPGALRVTRAISGEWKQVRGNQGRGSRIRSHLECGIQDDKALAYQRCLRASRLAQRAASPPAGCGSRDFRGRGLTDRESAGTKRAPVTHHRVDIAPDSIERRAGLPADPGRDLVGVRTLGESRPDVGRGWIEEKKKAVLLGEQDGLSIKIVRVDSLFDQRSGRTHQNH
jgi:hypothetical protein